MRNGKFTFDWLNFVIGFTAGAILIAVVGNL